MERVAAVKHALPREMNMEMALNGARRNPDALGVVHDPARIQGGNWKMNGFRHSGNVYDEAELQTSIAEFMADLERYDDVE